MTGSAGSNRLYSYADYSRLSDSPRTFSYRVDGFDSVTADIPAGGRNYAFLYDSPENDVLEAAADRADLDREDGSATRTAIGFERVYVYATQGGTDTATMTGSVRTQNRFYGYADYSILTESRRSFYFYCRGFDTVTGNSSGTGTTYAYLYDSTGSDTFTASPTSATMEREGFWPDATATGFQRVYAYSTHGGGDTAELTGNEDGGNYYRGYPMYSTLTDSARSFYHYARGFRSVMAIGSETGRLTDRAYLYDSIGNDTLFGRDTQCYLEDTAGITYHNEVWYFDYIYARSTDDDATTDDTVNVEDLAYYLLKYGSW
jgi:hypothetical protein